MFYRVFGVMVVETDVTVLLEAVVALLQTDSATVCWYCSAATWALYLTKDNYKIFFAT